MALTWLLEVEEVAFSDFLIAVLVLLIIFLIIYTKIKDQNLQETLTEIKNAITKNEW